MFKQKTFLFIKSVNRWHLVLAAFLMLLTLFLAVRASDDYRWSDWGFGDAQTMLSLKQWEEGGWLNNYLLFKPQGYASVINILDEPELRHHAHGTCPGSSPRVGPRLWYTHYPAGYLVPYAFLFRVGLDSLFAARMLSIVFSITALVFMYLVFAKLTSPGIAGIAVAFYGLSSAFLGYADSLANQPIDDLLRFAFMYTVVMSARAGDTRIQRNWLIAAWVIEFSLSLSSFDSVFFVYAWLIGWDLIDKRGFRWKRYLLFSLAPVSAHGLQFLQNVWYLGWNDALVDIKDAFLLKHGVDTAYNIGQNRLDVIIGSVSILFENLFQPIWALIAAVVLYLIYVVGINRDDRALPSLSMLGVLFLCGLIFILVLPHAARMPYEARQMMPFVSLVAGGLTFSFFKAFVSSLQAGVTAQSEGGGSYASRFVLPYLVFSMGILLVFWYGFVMSERRPVYDISDINNEVSFAQELSTVHTKHDPVFYDIGGFQVFWDPNYVHGYPQIMPITEYYTGSRPILCFSAPDKISADITIMVRKGKERFSPVLIASDGNHMMRVFELLEAKRILIQRPAKVYTVKGRYVADLTDSINWEGGN